MKKLLKAAALGLLLVAAAQAQQRRQTDREFEGLKGPVKSVSVDAAELERQGASDVEGRRAPVLKATFNADGSLAADEEYDGESGRLFIKRAYRYVGGVRLAEGEVIVPTISIDPALLPPGATQPIPPPPPGAMQPLSERHRRKYDARGNVTELTIEEGGRVRSRIVYKLKGDTKETLSYSYAGGGLVGRLVDRFDARGNLVESSDYDTEPGGGVLKHSYAGYEFDERGNWVKRVRTETGGGGPESRRVEYRTISYF